ncbi:hypothetical protein GOP47_0026475 [Adiantum capillus-veneris]|nr:hypothetical protein GOP47_0026475 [Adiantum capillus-veneris]
MQGGSEREECWELISGLTLWFIWRARCFRIFEARPVPPAETVRDFWLEPIHTLRGQLEGLQGSSDHMRERREAFLRLWRPGPFFTIVQGVLRWHYCPYVWLFPPPIS